MLGEGKKRDKGERKRKKDAGEGDEVRDEKIRCWGRERREKRVRYQEIRCWGGERMSDKEEKDAGETERRGKMLGKENEGEESER